MKDPVRLVGYWNGDEDNPSIMFNTPSTEQKEYSLVVIEILEPFEHPEERIDVQKVNRASKKLERLYSNKAHKKITEANKSLSKMSKILKRLK